MLPVTRVAMAALVADGLLAGLPLDKVIVQLPARRRIGVTAYAAYARAADLGSGIAFYAAGRGRRGADDRRVRHRGHAGSTGGRDRAPRRGCGLVAAAQRRDRPGRPTMFQIGRATDTEAALMPC